MTDSKAVYVLLHKKVEANEEDVFEVVKVFLDKFDADEECAAKQMAADIKNADNSSSNEEYWIEEHTLH